MEQAMHAYARALVDDLMQHPDRLPTLEAVRRELDSPKHAEALSKILRWWATYAPDDQAASKALLDAARRLSSARPDDPAILTTLIAALMRDASNNQAASEIRAQLERAGDFHELEQIFADWVLATRRDGCSRALCALSSFTLAQLRIRHTEDLEGAIEALNDALHAFPEHPEAKRALAGLYARRARDRAHDHERAAREDRHRAAQLFYELGTFDIGDPAIMDLQRALDLVPNHGEALDALLRRLGATRLALRRARLTAYVATAPDRVHSHRQRFELVRCLFRERRHAEAVPHLMFLSSRGYAKAEQMLKRLCPKTERPSQPPLPQRAEPEVYDAEGRTSDDMSRIAPADPAHDPYVPEVDTAPTHVYDSQVRNAVLASVQRAADNDGKPTTTKLARALRRVSLEHTLGLTMFALTSLVALTSYWVGVGP